MDKKHFAWSAKPPVEADTEIVVKVVDSVPAKWRRLPSGNWGPVIETPYQLIPSKQKKTSGRA